MMKHRKASLGVAWYLGTIQYCVCLFAGGGIWFLFALLTGFFFGDIALQVAACAVLLMLIVAESLWAHMPGSGNELGDFIIDILTSAAIAGFGIAVVAAIIITLRG